MDCASSRTGVVVGLDVTARMIELAKQKAGVRPTPPPLFLVGDMLGIEARAERRAQAAGRHEVLDRDRNTGKSAHRLTAPNADVDGARRLARADFVQRAEGVQLPVKSADAGQRGVGASALTRPARTAATISAIVPAAVRAASFVSVMVHSEPPDFPCDQTK
jgi:hypothetical protein